MLWGQVILNPCGVRDGEDGLVTLYPGLIARGYAYLIPPGLLSISIAGRVNRICGRGGKHNVVKAQMNRYDSIGGDSLTYDEAGNLTRQAVLFAPRSLGCFWC